MDAMNSGAVLVVDEIEASMHPMLTRHLIEMLQDQNSNKNHAQLIFTTHDIAGFKIASQRSNLVCRER